MANPQKKNKLIGSEIANNLMKKYSIKPEINLPEPSTKLSIITTAKRRLNKQYRATVSEIVNRFEDLSEDIDFKFDELEHKMNYKFKHIS